MNLNIAIVGPGRSKQGTGPYIARTLKQLGNKIVGIVSSSLESGLTAQQQLHSEYAIDCEVFEDLHSLLSNHSVDIVAVSSPISSHFDYLKTAAEHGCHVFCEKALWWPDFKIQNNKDIETITDRTIKLCNLFKEKELQLQLNTQWPFTLPAYNELFPNGPSKTSQINHFEMWLCPQSTNETVIMDAIPHPLSMLYCLLGAGKLLNINYSQLEKSKYHNLLIEFDYYHSYGECHVSINLNSTNTNPKPAAYAINHQRADRHVELPEYLISLANKEKSLPITDPLESSIKNFIASVYSKCALDEVALIDGMTHLAQIHLAVTTK